jgi:hypothetical protein
MVGTNMSLFRTDPDRGIAATLTQLADGIQKLITQHLTLARLEISQDARALGKVLARMAVFVPFVLVGYALLCGALAVLLSRAIPLDAALAVVGGVNAVAGAIGLYFAAQTLKGQELMDESRKALASTATLASQVATNTSPPTSENTHGR